LRGNKSKIEKFSSLFILGVVRNLHYVLRGRGFEEFMTVQIQEFFYRKGMEGEKIVFSLQTTPQVKNKINKYKIIKQIFPH